MESKAGREIHQQAEEARERGDLEEASNLTDKAMLKYQEDGDELGFAESLASRVLVLRHLSQKTEDKSFLIIAKHLSLASVEVAEKSGDKKALAIPYFNLAKAQQELEEFKEAIPNYKKAIENIVNNPPENHNRPAIIADFKIHLAGCEYQAGDKAALQRLEEGLEELEKADEASKYNKDVWVSGTHMRIAEMLREDDRQKAENHLQKAKQIIDANPDLKLRLGQWEKLATTFK